MRRRLTRLTMLVTGIGLMSLLIRGCSGDRPAVQPPLTTRTAAPVSVVIHLSGLLLVVPPKHDGGQTHVLLPKTPGHAAWLGFGVAGDEPYLSRLCLADSRFGQPALRAGICYVDLDRWQLRPFGAGGQPTPARNTLPAGVLNMTAASGGRHRVHLPSLGSELRAHVVFDAGQVAGHCSLASWIYEPMAQRGRSQRQDSLALVNVLRWEIRNPAAPVLVFQSESDTVTVPLPSPDGNGRTEFLLTHVPVEELRDLPPGSGSPAGTPPDTAHHFAAFYNLLRGSSVGATRLPQHIAHRPLPHSPFNLSPNGCEVRVTSWYREPAEELLGFEQFLAIAGTLRSFDARRHPDAEREAVGRVGTKTYACVVGSADRF